MNLKFFEDIYQTIKVMENGFYYLGLLTGLHTVTFAVYLAYRYLNDSKKGDSKNQETELSLPLVENPVLEMQDISDLVDKVSDNDIIETELIDKRKEYRLLLEQKRNNLGGLILQLDTVYYNIGQIRERLENLNNKTE
jgi:hypothetical protein